MMCFEVGSILAVAGATDVDDARVVSRSECVCAERLASKLE